MKRISVIAIALLASLAAAGSASAQIPGAKANIPFGFYVGDKWLPAGTYTMSADDNSSGVISIENADKSKGVLSLVQEDGNAGTKNVVVFKKYGDRYFLTEILCANGGLNVALPESKRQTEAQNHEADLGTPTSVYLALK